MADADALTMPALISVVDAGSSGDSRCLGRQLVSFDTVLRWEARVRLRIALISVSVRQREAAS